MREMINSNIQLENLQRRESGINERITLRWILNKWGMKVFLLRTWASGGLF
jgi:hypothetical protein